jgi:hypothetical protein
MERTKARLGRYAAMGAAVLGASVLAPSPAYADEPTCYGDYCSRTYANETNCDEDAITLDEVEVTGRQTDIDGETYDRPLGKLELRSSERCGTKWARYKATTSSGVTSVHAEKSDGYETDRYIAGWIGNSDAGVYMSPQIYSPNELVYAFVVCTGLVNQSTGWK